MFVFLSVLILLAAILLILVVVIQNSKGGGLASGFSSSNQIMGVRKTTDFLEKSTWVLACSIVVLSIVSSGFIHSGDKSDNAKILEQSVNKENKEEVPVLPISSDQPELPKNK